MPQAVGEIVLEVVRALDRQHEHRQADLYNRKNLAENRATCAEFDRDAARAELAALRFRQKARAWLRMGGGGR